MADSDERLDAMGVPLPTARGEPAEQSQTSYIAELFVLHYASVHRFLSKKVRYDEAADLTQEAYYRLLRHAGTLRRGSAARALLFHTASNLARDHHRRRRSHREEQRLEIDMQEIAAEHPGPDDLLVRQQALSAIEGAIAAFPTDIRTVLSLRLSQNLSYGQIARTMNISTRTVARKMAAALERLALLCDTV